MRSELEESAPSRKATGSGDRRIYTVPKSYPRTSMTGVLHRTLTLLLQTLPEPPAQSCFFGQCHIKQGQLRLSTDQSVSRQQE
ncbi:hypothetical protein MHYP_G00336920 [Metynnis hypsauchen]